MIKVDTCNITTPQESVGEKRNLEKGDLNQDRVAYSTLETSPWIQTLTLDL